MTNSLLNILTLGIKPLLENQGRFHTTIIEFREKLSKRQERKLSVADIDDFFQKINNFNFSFMFFAEYYRKYIENLNRFKPDTEEQNPDITFLLIAIAEDKWKPTQPFHVLKHLIQYKYPLTSLLFISRQKKLNRKKIDASGLPADKNSEKISVENGYRVPLRNQSKTRSTL